MKNAFYNPKIGGIDIFWGNKDMGLLHIIQRRKSNNIDIKDFLSNMAEVIEKGQVFLNKGNRYEVFYEGKMAVIAPNFNGDDIRFVLTAVKQKTPNKGSIPI